MSSRKQARLEAKQFIDTLGTAVPKLNQSVYRGFSS